MKQGGQLGDGGRGGTSQRAEGVRSGWLATCLDDISRIIFVFQVGVGGVQCGGCVCVSRLKIRAGGGCFFGHGEPC